MLFYHRCHGLLLFLLYYIVVTSQTSVTKTFFADSIGSSFWSHIPRYFSQSNGYLPSLMWFIFVVVVFIIVTL